MYIGVLNKKKSILFFSHKKTAENYFMINKSKLQFLNNL